MRMLDTQRRPGRRLVMRMVDRRKIQTLGCRSEIVVLVVTHRAVAVVKPDLLLLLLLLLLAGISRVVH